MIAGGIFSSAMSRATRSGTFSLKFFHAMCDRPDPVKPTMSTRIG